MSCNDLPGKVAFEGLQFVELLDDLLVVLPVGLVNGAT
jgi:hypothetical protein